MLEQEKLPVYLYFKNGNTYSGAHEGMRYQIRQGGRPEPDDPSGKKKIPYLEVKAWPEPWSIENTDPAKISTQEFSPDLAGLEQGVNWLKELLVSRREDWENIPSILDCQPWKPAPEPEETEKDTPPWE